MKRLLLLFFFFPFLLIGQDCTTFTSVLNADSVQYCVTNTTCYDTCNGVISITVFGDNHPYSFEWFNNSTPWVGISVQDTLCPGDYIITITDVNGNLVNNSHINTIEAPPNFSVFEESLISPSCFNYNDGFIDLTIAGATPFDPDGIANSGDEYYTYLWEEGTSTEDRTSLDSGIYIISITDANGCNRVDSFELFNPDKVNSQTITDTLSCIGACDGDGVVIPNSGFTPYSFLWDDPLAQDSATATGLCYGLSTVYITDSMGCLDTNTVFIENPDTLKLSNITIDSTCYQICDGQLSVTIEGGTGPYNVSWNFGGVEFNTTDTITDDTLCPGAYQLIFSDDNNCIDTADIILIERDSFNLSSSVIDDSCFNSCTGQVSVLLLNPNNPPFIYNWDNGASYSIASNLCSDSISMELIDVRGCRDTFYYFVDEPDSLSFDSIDVIHNLCYSDNNGAITVVNFTGGVFPITYFWNGSSSGGTPGISSLPSGLYDLQIQDANECAIDVANIEVTEPDSLHIFYTPSAVSCFGYSDGSISINLSGGTTPYMVNGITLLFNDTIISNLSAGEYLYSILDSNNCIRPEDSITVNEPDILEIDTTLLTHVLCHGDNTGSIYLTIIGGTSPYSYLWSNSDTIEDLPTIAAGTYTVSVTDNKGCAENGTYIITEPQFPITSNISTPTDILCNGDNTGVADLTVSGGTSPYSYQWSTAATTQDIDNLIAGNYSVDIIDANGCTFTDNVTINEPAELLATSTTTDITCYGYNDGTATLTLSGGTGTLTVNWFGMSPTALPPGTHNYSVTDINGCIFNGSVNILEPGELLATSTTTDITCYGYNDGTAILTLSGGTGTLTVNWFGMNPTALPPVTHNYSVTDINGCTFNGSVNIIEPAELLVTSTTTNVTCNGGTDGTATLTLSGGTGILTVNWFGMNPTALPHGTHNYSVTDANNCSKTGSVIITEPLAYLPNFDLHNVMCFGDFTGSIDFTISGNTSPYTYTWSHGANTPNIKDLAAGTYSVTIEDANGCVSSFQTTITQPEDLILGYSVYHATCEENDDGSIITNVSGGTMPYTYLWSDGSSNSDLHNLSKGLYTIEVRDANSCVYPTQTIEVGFEGYDGCIEIPTGFTPNGDGIHDEWSIYGLYHFSDVLVKIFNRWGQQVFESNGYDVPWDGKYNGKDLPIATYYYIIELTDSGKIFNGTVTIKR